MRWFRWIGAILIFLLAPIVAIILFRFTTFRLNQTGTDVWFTVISGAASSVVASGLMLLVAWVFQDEIRATIGDLLGYDKAPQELQKPVGLSISLEKDLSEFSKKMQRLINTKLQQADAEQAYQLHRQAVTLHSELSKVFERVQERVNNKNALTANKQPFTATPSAKALVARPPAPEDAAAAKEET